MNAAPPGRSPTTAWQPFTFGGVAAFARAAFVRLLLASALVAALVGWTVERVIRLAWVPAIETAVRNLPPTGEIRAGVLLWPTNAVATLADTRFLTIAVNPNVAPLPGSTADVTIEFTASALCLHSLFGYWAWPYPQSRIIALNQPTVEPMWAAWRPYVRLAVLGGTLGGLLVVWALLGLIAAPGLRAYVWILHRQASLGACWRLAMAAFLPGGVLIAAALFFYATHAFVLTDVVITFALAHLLDLILMLGAPWCLPRERPAAAFAGSPTGGEEEAAVDQPSDESSPDRPLSPTWPARGSPFADRPRFQRTTNPFTVRPPAAANPPPAPTAEPPTPPAPLPPLEPVAPPKPAPPPPEPAPPAAPPPPNPPPPPPAPAAPVVPPPPEEDEPVFNPS